ncbi:response regulator [Falsochrobactrum sp. TDYN1]|uniref:Response regulator n=1 Tax=Falsochrobactrum tianjinense TaxID=2706015 RepID=A0A949PQ92_9HYPH|nr:response regulator [Falsochrobactrum sp. TDYN1]MBV2144694.1 response regulator [Falsochrobactrum sp. TDYN1]
MTLSTRIAPHLPYLRRFSRALTGSQVSGDAYVAATLEALIADISIFPDASTDRIALYRLFCNLYKTASIPMPEPTSELTWEKHTARNLSHIAPLPRQAFLLVAVEGFSDHEAAEVLETNEADFGLLLSSASAEISKQVATRLMIIEDEPLIAMDIEQMVESLGHEVVGIARTKEEALTLYRQEKPRMILADIQLADGSSGIDAVNEILQDDTVPVIFITAFPERLLTGERPEPTFLVTKPFNPDMVKALISQALFFEESAQVAA